MLNLLKRYPISVIISATLLLTVLLSLTIHEQLSLLYFINISFYFSSAYIFIGLLIFVTNQGFFDGISHGFRKLFKNNHNDTDKSEIIPLSQIVSIPYAQLLYSGLILLFIMIVCLWFYY